MSRTKVLEYLKYLHELEHKYKTNLITLDLASLVEQVRLKFVAANQEQ